MRILAAILVAALITYGVARPNIQAEDSKLLSNQATQLLHDGQPLKAWDKYQEALEADPGNSIVLYNISQIYFTHWNILMERLNVSKQEIVNRGIIVAKECRDAADKDFLKDLETAKRKLSKYKKELQSVSLGDRAYENGMEEKLDELEEVVFQTRGVMFLIYNNYAGSIWFGKEVLGMEINIPEARQAYQDSLKYAIDDQITFTKLMIIRTFIAEDNNEEARKRLMEMKDQVHPSFFFQMLMSLQ